MDSILASRPAAPGSNLGFSKIFSEMFLSLLDVAELIDSKHSAIKLNKLSNPSSNGESSTAKKSIQNFQTNSSEPILTHLIICKISCRKILFDLPLLDYLF